MIGYVSSGSCGLGRSIRRFQESRKMDTRNSVKSQPKRILKLKSDDLPEICLQSSL
jgi:hypothetical protein